MITLVANPAIVIVDKESVGKTQLLASLAGRTGRAQNFRGSTVAVERFSGRSGDADELDAGSDGRLSGRCAAALPGDRLDHPQRARLAFCHSLTPLPSSVCGRFHPYARLGWRAYRPIETLRRKQNG